MPTPKTLFSLAHPFVLAIGTLFLAQCSSKLAEKNPEGDWLGTLKVTQGICPTDRSAALTIEKKTILFSPDNGALILRGVYNKKQRPRHFVARLDRSDMDHKPYPLVFEGRPQGETIIGIYGTPDCRATVVLHRPKAYGVKDFIAH
ncbi:hypothetical protein COMNV_00296 [Commensalibacter sp. Nvir]|nr:hypothetical protein COMNV_00296 [Commensalibacter sp. Nvir]